MTAVNPKVFTINMIDPSGNDRAKLDKMCDGGPLWVDPLEIEGFEQTHSY